MMDCPSCGRKLSGNMLPVVDLYTNTLMLDGELTKLTPMQAEYLHVIIRRMPEGIERSQLLAEVYGGLGDEPSYRSFLVYMCELRKRIRHTRLSLQTPRYRPGMDRYYVRAVLLEQRMAA